MNKICIGLLLILISLMITACGTEKVGSIADMSGYEKLDDKTTQVFIVSDVKDFIDRLDKKETFVAYFGFKDCPWCNDALSILNNEAIHANRNIYYINTRPNKSVKANNQIPNYQLLVDRVGTNFSENDEGVPYLFVPYVFFIKNGVVKMTHEGTIDGYDPSIMDMPEHLREELAKKYREGFDALK